MSAFALIIDELASLTAYMSDNTAKKEADRPLASILSRGRPFGLAALGVEGAQRRSAKPVVLTGLRAVGGVDALQRSDEVG